MKKAKRLIALLLAVVMIATGSSISAFALKFDTKTPQTDENGKYYFTPEQAGTWAMDFLDDFLSSGVNNGMALYVDLSVKTYTLHLYGYDTALSSIWGLWDSSLFSVAESIGILGDDLGNLNMNRVQNYDRRGHATIPDINCLYNLLGFLNDNAQWLAKIVNGTFDWGCLGPESYHNMIYNADILPPEILDLGNTVKNLLYPVLMDLAGVPDAVGTDLDSALQAVVNYLIGDLIPGLTTAQLSVTNISTYQLVNNLIDGALQTLVVPLLSEALVSACDLEVSADWPLGNPDDMNNTTLQIIIGAVEELVEGSPSYSAEAEIYPVQKINELLDWFFLEGGMSTYIVIDYNGISLTDGFNDLLNRLIRLAIPLVYNLGFDKLPQSEIYTTAQLNIDEGAPGYIPDSAVYAQLLKILLSDFIDGFYCNPQAATVAEVGAYAVASLAARILPDKNYFDRLDANYADGTYYDYLGNSVTPLPFTTAYTAVGRVAGTNVSKTYTIPLAAIEIGYNIGIFYLDGLVTADFTKVTADGTAGMEQFIKVLMDWAINKYLPLFNTTYNIPTNFPNASDCWKEIDTVILSLIPSDWMVEGIDADSDDVIDFPLDSSLDLLGGWLCGSVMDLDLQELLQILQRNQSGELNQPLMTVLLRVIDRVFYVILANYAVLPPNQGTRNAYVTPTSINSVSALLNSGYTGSYNTNNSVSNFANFGQLAYYLLKGLYTNRVAILETLLPLIMGLTYIKPFRDVGSSTGGILELGQISVAQLEAYIEEVNSINSVKAPYVVANVDATTRGTYYTIETGIENGVFVANETPVVLDGTNFDMTQTYYTVEYSKVATLDRFAEGVYYTRNYDYTPVTLSGANVDPKAIYCSTDYTEAVVDETTNGTYYTAQNEGSAVVLPNDYIAGTTYYEHAPVYLGSSAVGNYYLLTYSYDPVTLIGTAGNNFITGKDYYKVKTTSFTFNYLDSHNDTTHKLAMGNYASGGPDVNGVGRYVTSISGEDFYVFREAEDFPDALYAYNNFNSFLEDAASFISDYKHFVTETMYNAAQKWKNYLNGTNPNPPSELYPYYNASNSYDSNVGALGLFGNFNDLQAIKDFINLYGASAFITSATTNVVVSGTHNKTVPLNALPRDRNSGTTDADCEIFAGWTDYIKEVEEYSNKLNNYFDGINYYLNLCENSRQPYTETNPAQLNWCLNKYAAAYNNGRNGTYDGGTGVKAYTDKTYAAFKDAYECAQDLVSQINLSQSSFKTTQSMVSKIREGLMTAYYALVEFGSMADTYQLLQYIVQARRIIADEDPANPIYTAESFDALVSGLAAAEVVYDTGYGSDEQNIVDGEAARLYARINALIYLAAPGIVVNDGIEDNPVEVSEPWVTSGITYGYIYGLAESTGLVWSNGAVNNTLSVVGLNSDGVTLVNSSYGPGTGSYLIGRAQGLAKFRYYAILFGDVNGDARVDGTDKITILAHTTGASTSDITTYEMLAADVNNDGVVDASDATEVEKVYNYTATIKQSEFVEGSRIVLN